MITMSSHVMTPTIYFHIDLQLFSTVYKSTVKSASETKYGMT